MKRNVVHYVLSCILMVSLCSAPKALAIDTQTTLLLGASGLAAYTIGATSFRTWQTWRAENKYNGYRDILHKEKPSATIAENIPAEDNEISNDISPEQLKQMFARIKREHNVKYNESWLSTDFGTKLYRIFIGLDPKYKNYPYVLFKKKLHAHINKLIWARILTLSINAGKLSALTNDLQEIDAHIAENDVFTDEQRKFDERQEALENQEQLRQEARENAAH